MSIRIRALSALSVIIVLSSGVAAQTPAPTAAPGAPAPAATPAPVAAPEPAAPAEPAITTYVEPSPAAPIVEAPVEEEAPAKVGYDKGFFIESGDGNNRLVLGGRLQFRYTYLADDDAPDSSAFSIERARIKLEGHVISKDLTYLIQPELGKGSLALRDFFFDYRVVPDWLHFRVGQFYRPFSRQQVTSDGNQSLVDRAITDSSETGFGGGRDIGLMLHNNYEKSPEIEYALGLYNGTGERAITPITVETDETTDEVTGAENGTQTNVPKMLRPALVGRIGYNYGELKGYSEVDLEGGPLRFGVGASGQVDFDADRNDDSQVKAELDAIVKVHGFDATAAGYVSSAQAGEDFGDRALAKLGFHVQAGYLFGGKYQLAARYAVVAPDGDDDDLREIAGVLGYFASGHNLKWQTDVAALSSQQTNTTDLRLRAQLQFAF
jgi:hypothetical protein